MAAGSRSGKPGERLASKDRAEVDAAIYAAETASRIEFSVFVGDADGDAHAFATRLHNTLLAPARSVLIMVDPNRRVVEIVTGGEVRRRVTDGVVAEAVDAMTARFADGDLVGGIVRGIQHLAAQR